MKKIIIIILTFLGVNNIVGSDLSANLEEISSNLINLENIYTKIKPETKPAPQPTTKEQTENEKFYENLNKALNKSTFNEILKALDGLPQWRATLTAKNIIKLLRKDSPAAISDLMFIRYKTLEITNLPKFGFVNYILLISKVIETIMTEPKQSKTISIFSDDILSEPLFMYLLLSSLHKLQYNSININIASAKGTNYTNLRKILKEDIPNSKYNINEYTTIKELIDSGNKIDIYISNLTYPGQSNGFICTWNIGKIFAEHSKVESSDYLISSKRLTATAPTINTVFKNLVKFLKSPDQMTSKHCQILPRTHTDLADIIYSTNKSSGKKVPLFVYTDKVIDTKVGIDRFITIIESRLNFTKYVDLFSALFKTRLAIDSENFSKESEEFQLFIPDKNDNKKFILLNGNLDNTPSVITTFVRGQETIAPSETVIKD